MINSFVLCYIAITLAIFAILSYSQFRGSLNTTSGSLNKSLGVTSSVSLPNYSVDYEEDEVS